MALAARELERGCNDQRGGDQTHATQRAAQRQHVSMLGDERGREQDQCQREHEHARHCRAGAAPAIGPVTDDERQVDDVGPRQRLRQRQQVDELGRREPARALDQFDLRHGDGAAKGLQRDPIEDPKEFGARGRRAQARLRWRVGVRGHAQRRTFSASGLTRLVGSPRRKATTLSNAALKRVS